MRREGYVGRVGSERSRQELLRLLRAYHRRAVAEFARRRSVVERRPLGRTFE